MRRPIGASSSSATIPNSADTSSSSSSLSSKRTVQSSLSSSSSSSSTSSSITITQPSACTQGAILVLLAFGVVVIPHHYYYNAGCQYDDAIDALQQQQQRDSSSTVTAVTTTGGELVNGNNNNNNNNNHNNNNNNIATGFAHHIQSMRQLFAKTSTKQQQQQQQHPKRFCPCCGWYSMTSLFDKVPWGQVRPDGLCPQCQSCERHRRTCALLGSQPQLLQSLQSLQSTTTTMTTPFRLLHFGPQQHMEQELNNNNRNNNNNNNNLDQIGLDYFAGTYQQLYSKNTLHADVSNLQLPNHFANGIIILHVLEHVPQLSNALSELKRVLLKKKEEKNDSNSNNNDDSWMIVEVPYLSKDGTATADCRDLKTDQERIDCAGQADHVWAFAQNDFEHRLDRAGFHCQNVIPMIRRYIATNDGEDDSTMLDAMKLTTDNFSTVQYFCQVKSSQ